MNTYIPYIVYIFIYKHKQKRILHHANGQNAKRKKTKNNETKQQRNGHKKRFICMKMI